MNLCFVSVFMNYFDNPGGMIPTWLVNWAAKVSAALLFYSSSCQQVDVLFFTAIDTHTAGVNHFQFDQKSSNLLKPDYPVK